MPVTPPPPFELALFAADLDVVVRAVLAGVSMVVVDWESQGKHERQAAADTEINGHTVDDLRRARAATAARLLCRLNPSGPWTPAEVEEAVAAGADELLLPMVRSAAEVGETLELVAGRAGLGILVETRAAVALAGELARLPLSRVYVGLNDLAIERGTASIFAPLVDGTLDEVRGRLADVPLGFGGLTLPEAGAPLPCRLLAGELARTGAAFTFLRRSFYRDVAGRDPAAEVPRILAAMERAFARSPEEEARDRDELVAAVATHEVSPSARAHAVAAV